MVCIHCGSDTRVTNSRRQKRLNQTWRRRQCLKCGAVFTTEEATNYGGEWAVRDKDGALRPFSRDKLFLSLYESCRHRAAAQSDASALTDTVIMKLSGHLANGTIDSRAIVRVVQVALNRFDKVASVHYLAFHRL